MSTKMSTMSTTRTIDTEHNWFWQQGYRDGLDGERAIRPDETRHPFQATDYFAGYYAGREARAADEEEGSNHEKPR